MRGRIAAAQGHPDKAIRLYRRALHGYQEHSTGTARQAALTMVDLGTALTAAGQEHEAGTILRQAAELLARPGVTSRPVMNGSPFRLASEARRRACCRRTRQCLRCPPQR